MSSVVIARKTSAIVAEKQRLRDITKLADTADTLEALKLMEIK